MEFLLFSNKNQNKNEEKFKKKIIMKFEIFVSILVIAMILAQKYLIKQQLGWRTKDSFSLKNIDYKSVLIKAFLFKYKSVNEGIRDRGPFSIWINNLMNPWDDLRILTFFMNFLIF